MKISPSILEPVSEFTELSSEFTRLTPINYFKNAVILRGTEPFVELLKKIYQKKIDWTDYEKKFMEFALESFKDGKNRINRSEARRLLALSMEAITERAELVKRNVQYNLKDDEIYTDEFMKLNFIMDSNIYIINRIKELVVLNSARTNDLDDYKNSLTHLFWAYQYLLGEKEVDLDSLMSLTSEIRQKELRESYNVKFN